MCSVLSMYLHQEGIIIFYKSTVLQTKPIQHQPICISAHINRYVTLASFYPLNWTWMIANSSRLLLQKRKAYSGYKGFIETGRDQKIDQQKEAIYLSEDKWMSSDVVQQRALCRQQSIHLWNSPERSAPLANSCSQLSLQLQHLYSFTSLSAFNWTWFEEKESERDRERNRKEKNWKRCSNWSISGVRKKACFKAAK